MDITAPAHVLVFRPLIALMRERGDEVQVTARDDAQTVQLLEQHGIEAELIGKHGGRSWRAATFRRRPRRDPTLNGSSATASIRRNCASIPG